MSSSQKVWERAFERVTEENQWTIRDLAVLNILRKYVNNGDTILDVGCGTGKFSLLLTREGARTILLDFSLPVLRMSRELFSLHNNKDADFILADIRNMPIKDNTADVCFSEGVIEHFRKKERKEILSEKTRTTRNEGFVITSCPNKLDALYQMFRFIYEATGRWKYGSSYLLSMLELESLMRSVGLEITERRGTLNNLLFFPLYFAFRHHILKRLSYPRPDDRLAIRLGKVYVPPILGFWLICVGAKNESIRCDSNEK